MRAILLLFFALLPATALAKDHVWKTGKLLAVERRILGDDADIGRAVYTVVIDDLVYELKGQRLNMHASDYSKGLIVGDPVKVDVEGNGVYLQLPDGKDIKTQILTRSRQAKQ